MASLPLTTSRRTLFGQVGLLGLATLPWSTRAYGLEGQAGDRGALMFNAYRNDSYLGYHRLNFSGSNERLVVDIEIAFDVKIAFIPFYRYRHKNREVWEKGKLMSLDTETDDNGTDFKVKAIRAGDRLLVDGADGRLDLPGDSPTTSYWNEQSIERGAWIDTQSGRLARSTVTKNPEEPVLIEGQSLQATRYDLDGDITCSLWYAKGRWAKLLFIGEDGSKIAYAIEEARANG